MEESFMVELYNISRRKDSIDIVMQIIEDGSITKEELKNIEIISQICENECKKLVQNFFKKRR